MARKLGMPTSQRLALLKNQVSNLLWNGKIETTLATAKDVRSYAEKVITIAIKGHDDTVKVTKKAKETDKKGNVKTVEKQSLNDGAKKLAARRKLMSSLNDLQEIKDKSESKSAYKARTKDVRHPLIERLFNEIAPKYAERAKELGQGGGYTRILKLGPRKGDATEMAIVELI